MNKNSEKYGAKNENSSWQEGWELNERGKRKYSVVKEMLYVVVVTWTDILIKIHHIDIYDLCIS